MKDGLLEVGDVIFEDTSFSSLSKLTISRVTERYAFFNRNGIIETKLRRNVVNGIIYNVNRERFSTTSYRIFNEKDETLFKRQVCYSRIKDYNFKSLSLSKLERILAILEEI